MTRTGVAPPPPQCTLQRAMARVFVRHTVHHTMHDVCCRACAVPCTMRPPPRAAVEARRDGPGPRAVLPAHHPLPRTAASRRRDHSALGSPSVCPLVPLPSAVGPPSVRLPSSLPRVAHGSPFGRPRVSLSPTLEYRQGCRPPHAGPRRLPNPFTRTPSSSPTPTPTPSLSPSPSSSSPRHPPSPCSPSAGGACRARQHARRR